MFKFEKKTERIIRYITEYAQNARVCAYFVGGMVRDCLMEIGIKDIDILIEGSAIDFIEKFALEYKDKLDIKIKSVHKSFNTAKTVIEGVEIDFASTREEKYPKSGCLPAVTKIGCSISDDLKRRDFTINSIAVKLLLSSGMLNYEIIDPFNGADDIRRKILTVLHNKSYIDDPTRILRGLDFSLRFGFDFSKKDKILIGEYLKNPDREGLSFERVKLTLKKLFSDEKRTKPAYKSILDNKFYKIWEDKPSFKKEWAQKLFEAVSIFNINPAKVFQGAIFENSKLQNPMPDGTSNYEIYNFYKTFKPLDLALQYAIFNDKNTVFYFKKLKNVKLDVTGDDLIKQGFTQGKELGEELNRLLEEKLNSIL